MGFVGSVQYEVMEFGSVDFQSPNRDFCSENSAKTGFKPEQVHENLEVLSLIGPLGQNRRHS